MCPSRDSIQPTDDLHQCRHSLQLRDNPTLEQMDTLEGTAAYTRAWYTIQSLYQSRFSCQQLWPMKRTQLEQGKSEEEGAVERSCYGLSSFHSQSSCAPQESGVKN